ncbi:MAG: DNA alkylation repair protein [Methanobacterium sp.]|nr:DNA alkylation repair protein [Methanobacterium sp.]
MELQELVGRLESLSKPENIEGMARFGITPEKTYAVRIPELRKIAKETGKNHEMALKLWELDFRETKILACMIEDPEMVSSAQMNEWTLEFDYWEICDQCCMNLFSKTKFAYEKIFEWGVHEEEFVKRAAFSLLAVLAVHDKKQADEQFEQYFPLLISASTDNRNFVKKSVNWALRSIGKKNSRLNKSSIDLAEEIFAINTKSSKWIASNALKELRSEKVRKKVGI